MIGIICGLSTSASCSKLRFREGNYCQASTSKCKLCSHSMTEKVAILIEIQTCINSQNVCLGSDEIPSLRQNFIRKSVYIVSSLFQKQMMVKRAGRTCCENDVILMSTGKVTWRSAAQQQGWDWLVSYYSRTLLVLMSAVSLSPEPPSFYFDIPGQTHYSKRWEGVVCVYINTLCTCMSEICGQRGSGHPDVTFRSAQVLPAVSVTMLTTIYT